ncbi:putative enoyl-CoA hydratase paaG [Mycobacterium xenopi 3993]|nr:putative enoyl-CoA hydratase paaG [Mycobacterium xenopi 3993]
MLRIVLDRPDKLNAVNTPMLKELKARVNDGHDESVRVVVLTGAGRAFCSGGDLTGADTDGAVVAANEMVQAIAGLPKPVVAGVHGAAVGLGCSLALACDLVVAARSAFFQLAFTKVGLMPDGGASALVPVAIGRARAARMAILAEKIPAATAFEWGMISHVVDDESYDTELATVVQALASGPTMSYGWLKRALSEATLSALPTVSRLEVEGQTALTRTADFLEGVRAFVKRRSPKFQGR